MRTITLFCCITLLTLAGCIPESSNQGPLMYDALLFVRQGGGDKTFTVTPAKLPEEVAITVTRYQFRDTLVQFTVRRDAGTAEAFECLDQALRGKVSITGDFRQSTLPTGTWAYFYVVHAGERKEITNTDLRNRLSGFETIVSGRMPEPQ